MTTKPPRKKGNARLQPGAVENADAAKYSPIEPNAGTQAARLLAVLKSGRAIDPLAAWSELGIYRVADTVHRLRKKGWRIDRGTKHVQNRYGEQCAVASYRLTPADADKARTILSERGA